MSKQNNNLDVRNPDVRHKITRLTNDLNNILEQQIEPLLKLIPYSNPSRDKLDKLSLDCKQVIMAFLPAACAHVFHHAILWAAGKANKKNISVDHYKKELKDDNRKYAYKP